MDKNEKHIFVNSLMCGFFGTQIVLGIVAACTCTNVHPFTYLWAAAFGLAYSIYNIANH